MGYEPTEPIWSIIGFIFRVHLNPKYKPYKFRALFGGNLEGIKGYVDNFLDPPQPWKVGLQEHDWELDGLDFKSARSNGAYAHPESLRGFFLDLLGKLRVGVTKEYLSPFSYWEGQGWYF